MKMRFKFRIANSLLAVAALCRSDFVNAWSPAPLLAHRGSTTRRFTLNKSQQTEVASRTLVTGSNGISKQTEEASDQASKWKAEAERIRREAAQLDSDLTTQKIQAFERKLANQAWRDQNPDQADALQRQLVGLQNKIAGKSGPEPMAVQKTMPASAVANKSAPKTSSSSQYGESSKDAAWDRHLEENPRCGYAQEDLDLYIPVVRALEERMPQNATLTEKLEAFRQAPELQDHFQEKIRKLLVEPMEEMIRLESLRKDYLESSSSVERKRLKREIGKLEKTLQEETPIVYTDSVVLQDLPRLEEDEIQQRLEAVGELHPILQALYKQRCGVNETSDLRLAIEMDHYEPQLQLLERVHELKPMTDEGRHDIRLAILSLPKSVRDCFAQTELGLENGEDVAAMISALVDDEGEPWMSLQQVMAKAQGNSEDGSSELDLPEYNDLDFLDRSRYVKEFLPTIAQLEIVHPSKEDIDVLMKEVLDKKAFMVTSSPERVVGGYYIRGRNMLSDPETGTTDDMVQFLQERLQKSSLKDKIDLFYIQDPSPPTDEEYEMGMVDRPVLVATAKSREELYDPMNPLSKAAISLLGLCSVIIFAAATTQLQPIMRDQVEAAAAGDLSIDISPVISSASLVFASVLGIQLAHEAAHRVVAWRDKFDVDLPTLVPSIQIGLQGAITPLASPPPNNKSMFDFAIAGPLAGLLISLGLLVAGLEITASTYTSLSSVLPAFPVATLRSSELAGGLVEFFLGKGVLMSAGTDAVLPLHPFAIAGFSGVIGNALALLPLGNTDGGRVALTMFGRRGAYLVKIITTLVLCAAGLVGLDEQRIFLTYVLFTMIWQRELESPTLNEADDLDLNRCLLGLGSSMIVFLALLPMV